METRRGRRSLGTGVTDSCEPSCQCWELNPEPLQPLSALDHWAISPVPDSPPFERYSGTGDSSVSEMLALYEDLNLTSTTHIKTNKPTNSSCPRHRGGCLEPHPWTQGRAPEVHWLVSLAHVVNSRPVRDLYLKKVGRIWRMTPEAVLSDSTHTCSLVYVHLYIYVYSHTHEHTSTNKIKR